MEVDAVNDFSVSASSNAEEVAEGANNIYSVKLSGGCSILALGPASSAVMFSGVDLLHALDFSGSDLVGKHTDSRRTQQDKTSQSLSQEAFLLKRLGASIQRSRRWKTVLGPVQAQSLMSCACVDDTSRLHGVFVAVDYTVDALPSGLAIEFNHIHARAIESVSLHVASLLTLQTEIVAKSAQLKSSNEMISAVRLHECELVYVCVFRGLV